MRQASKRRLSFKCGSFTSHVVARERTRAVLSAHESTIAAHPHLHIIRANNKLISGRNKQMGGIKAQKLTAGVERATRSRAHTTAGQKEGTTGSLALVL